MIDQEKEITTNKDSDKETATPTYNFKWMLILLLVGIVGSFIFARFMK